MEIMVPKTIMVPYCKTFEVTKELEWDDKYRKSEEWDDKEYFDAEFAEEFEDEAKAMMIKHLNLDFREHDLDWDNMEYTDVGIDE